jgi:hypothetical protein
MEAPDEPAVRVPRTPARVEAFLGIARAQREWADVLQVFADEATTEQAHQRLVSELGYTYEQAIVVSTMNFFRLVGAEREAAAVRLAEASQPVEIAPADDRQPPPL